MKSFTFTVEPYAAESRLDIYLTRRIPDISRAEVQRLIQEGHVQVAGETIQKSSIRLSPGVDVAVEVPDPVPQVVEADVIPLSILLEDDDLIVLNKPPGLATHPGPGHPRGTLVNALLAHAQSLSTLNGPLRPGIVHRLDKETSGCLLVAKDDIVHKHLSEQFQSRSVDKEYVALLWGDVRFDQGTVEEPIGRHPRHRQKMAVAEEGGRDAVTGYRVMRRVRGATWVRLFPKTGRTHQIRVHMASIKHPVVGDRVYGKPGWPVAVPRQVPEPIHPRLMLHAHVLSFTHPRTGQRVRVEAPLPEEFRDALSNS